MYKLHLTVGAALVGLFLGAQSCSAAVVLFDNFDSDALALNWAGDSVFTSIPAPGNVNGLPSTDLVGTIPTDSYGFLCQGHGNCVDLDGSTGDGNDPAGQLVSNNIFGAGTYTLSFLLGGNFRGYGPQTTTVSLGDFLQDITLNSSDALSLYLFTFTTTGGALSFLEQGPSNQQGNILDEVSLSTVPLPASWTLMLFGLVAGFAFFHWKGRKEGGSFSAA
jgi:hypothetical protein